MSGLPNLKVGSQGEAVADLRKQMARYYELKNELKNELKMKNALEQSGSGPANLSDGIARNRFDFLQVGPDPNAGDPIFDSELKKAVIALQEELGIDKDGIVGPITRRKLKEVIAQLESDGRFPQIGSPPKETARLTAFSLNGSSGRASAQETPVTSASWQSQLLGLPQFHGWPLKQRAAVSSEFGARDAVPTNSGGVSSSNHEGIDLAVPVGTKLYSGGGKVVEITGVGSDYGYSVTIKLKDIRVRYAHMKEPAAVHGVALKVGDEVRPGQQIGLSGDTGNTNGPHLHFEVQQKQPDGSFKPINPRLLFPEISKPRWFEQLGTGLEILANLKPPTCETNSNGHGLSTSPKPENRVKINNIRA